ncbi:MAG: O-antigen ligase family protein [Pirellulales bacterium]|nr:O-antigen ligase family protein [Pirellulales bacterium]
MTTEAATLHGGLCPATAGQSAGESRLHRLAGFFTEASRSLTVALGFAIPVSTSLTEGLLVLLLICWLLSGDYAGRLRQIRGNPVAVWALVLLAVYAVGVTYSSAALWEAGDTLFTYRKLLYVAVFLTVFSDAPTRERAMAAFVLAMLVTLVASLLMWPGLLASKWGMPDNCAYFKSHIDQNTMMAFFVAVLANRALATSRYRWLTIAVILIAGYNILFMVDGRTGYLILFALICLVLFQKKGIRGLAAAGALILGLSAVAYTCSSEFRTRVDLAVGEARDYYLEGRNTLDSSIGQRLAFYKASLDVAAKSPLIGAGTGSFRNEYEQRTTVRRDPPVCYPHSEYFSALVQTGLIGLGVFLYWLYVQWTCCKRALPHLAPLAQALIVTFAVGSLVNSFMTHTAIGFLYCYFLGLCFADMRTSGSQPAAHGPGAHEAIPEVSGAEARLASPAGRSDLAGLEHASSP